ncbi:MAG: hypothetical protein GF317_05365 [Candidatus Lokiarchaeota archaeon]|nr:hypothetical protein [Candidatus Lokiarchaeota archaeon]MBD3199236.1 hypothetical protein [Candidatus Lokiarchaeota archaeon]
MSQKPSLLIIGNSNVGKSSITKLLVPKPSEFKGKVGKTPGSTLLIKPITQAQMPYKIVDLPGFGYMKSSSHRREEHIKQKIVKHIEKHHTDYFFGLVVLNILRIEDELNKYYIENTETIPLSFELISFLMEYQIPLLIIINKIDKASSFDKRRILRYLIKVSQHYGFDLVHLNDFYGDYLVNIPYLEFSATEKTNLGTLKKIIHTYLSSYKRNK